MSTIDETKKIILKVKSFLEQTAWSDEYAVRLQNMQERVDMPCELAIAGMVKAGKSSFLNALLGDDYAMVGETEMTATINYFINRQPPFPDSPIKVVWDDGHDEWKSKSFLDSLQGHTKEVLDRAKGIDHLEYYIQSDFLDDNVILIDTPGTNSNVDEHSQRTKDYIDGEEKLRKKHNEQSIALKNKADAVIVLVSRVEKSQEAKLIAGFCQDTKSFNSLGVMSKIDSEKGVTREEWMIRSDRYSKMLNQQLSGIMPVSANVYHAVTMMQKNGKLHFIQDNIKKIPDSTYQYLFDGNRELFKDNRTMDAMYEQYGLPLQTRMAMCNGLDWMVFYTIANELYRNDYEKAIENLLEYSGMEAIKTILRQQFFDRSRVIRCAKVIKDLKTILLTIRERKFYDLRKDVENREDYLRIIDEGRSNAQIKEAFRMFVTTNICTKKQYDNYTIVLNDLIKDLERIWLSIAKTDQQSEALLLLDKKRDDFSPVFVEELELLFGKYPGKSISTDRKYIFERQHYWSGEIEFAADKDVKRIMELAIEAYGIIKTE